MNPEADDRQKILIIDDTPTNIQILNAILRNQYRIFFATSGQTGLEIARREQPDLILLDIMMPGMNGYEVGRQLKESELTSGIPVIFVTAMVSAEEEARGLEAGAIDYLTKPVSPPIVRMRIRNHLDLKRQRDMLQHLSQELAEKNRILESLAREDGLTGVANRRQFDETLDAEVRRAGRSGQPLSLILCDIDFFKAYNDTYGHLAGDDCLRALAAILMGCFRRIGDLTARYGGEEFAVILPDTPADQAAQLGENLRQEVQKAALPHKSSRVAGCVTISVGVVTAWCPEHRTPEWFIESADRALYQSKEHGRNRVTTVVYDQGGEQPQPPDDSGRVWEI